MRRGTQYRRAAESLLSAVTIGLCSAVLPFVPGSVRAEEETPEGLQAEAVVAATFTQTSYTDWAEGGVDALAYVLAFESALFEEREHDKWRVGGALAFGQSKVGSDEVRISVNEIVLEGRYNYKLPEHWSAYAAAGFRSAIVTGYDYNVAVSEGDPPEEKLVDVEKASFNDPGYYTASFGAQKDFSRKPILFTTRVGAGIKYTTAREHFAFGYADDPDTPETDKEKLETGIDSVTDLDAKISEQLHYVSKLTLFSTFTGLDVWDVRWENTVTAKINKYVNTQFQLILLFDKDVSGKVQRFQMLSIGLAYAIL